MDELNLVISEAKKDYKCFDILKSLYYSNDTFKSVLDEGVKSGKIMGFPDLLWDKLARQNMMGIDNFVDVFRDGANLGYCTVASRQVSFSLPTCYICGGVVDYLIGTINSEDGSHTWIEYENYIIDTTLMLIIDKSYLGKLGYHEENRYNPNNDSMYLSAKGFATDTYLKK